MHALVTPATVDGYTAHDRSYVYGYDALSRLIRADRGEVAVDGSGQASIVYGSETPWLRRWWLDNLGNWSGGDEYGGSLAYGPDGDGDGAFDAEPPPYTAHHLINEANQVERLVRGPTITNTDLLHDRAGNIVFDGVYYLQYDAFHRLVQVHGAGTLTIDDFEVHPLGGPRSGRIKADCVSKLGGLVARYTYDGLGRLIRKEAPDGRREDYYYDGVRRLQEDVTPPSPATPWTERQYVYGPDYVDEFVAQIDKGDTEHPTGHVFYTLQDANYNVVALVGLVGSTWQVVEQYTYEPYGAVVAVDDLVPDEHPVNRVGHQGLFYEHLDAGDGLTVGAIGLYHNRNRWYSPALGRFISRDPNETALPIITALAMNAEAFSILADGCSAAGHFRDGMNLYAYLGSNPLNGLDPLGLYDPFEDVDDAIMGMAGEKAAAAHHAFAMIGYMAQRGAIMALQGTIAALFPPYGLYLSLEGAAFAMEDMLFNGPSWNNVGTLGLNALGVRGSFRPAMAQIGRFGARIRGAYNAVGRRYAQMGMGRSGFSMHASPTRVQNPLARGYKFYRAKRGSGMASGGLSWDDALEDVRSGADVVASDAETARTLAKEAGGGTPHWEAGHYGGLPHFHPVSATTGERVGGHVFY